MLESAGGGGRSIEATVALSKVATDCNESNRSSKARVRFWFSVMYAMKGWPFDVGEGAKKSIFDCSARPSQTCIRWYGWMRS